MICGSPLQYLEQSQSLSCTYCGKEDSGHIMCPSGHYICDTCHNRDAMKVIEDIVFSTMSNNPSEIAELAMGHPGLAMLGCQHAYIAGGALMAAIRNEGSRGITDEDIREVFSRTQKQAHGGYCGLTGVCGIAPAIGACFAVLTGSKCGKDEEQRITMEAVSRVSRAITGLTGPSCCKAYVRTSLDAAGEYLKESLSIELPGAQEIRCTHSHKHPHGCRESDCPYFTEGISLKREASAMGNTMVINEVRVQHFRKTDALEDPMERLLERALELGAEKARAIDPASVVVEEWVRWKCQYGCPLYNKDGFHPPCAPDAESTKKVLGEYSKAILLNGPKGKALTEVAVRLEGEAYHMGYYKAFSMTALSSGPPGVT